MKNSLNRKRIVLTGGGTAGHVMPNLALVPFLKNSGYEIHYIGSSGIERELIAKTSIPFHEISTGKLRRYFSMDNFFDVFKIVLGVIQAFFVLRRINPQVVFSKGGFVSVPVAIGAKLNRIPVISHESDFTPGLANKIISKFAKVLLYTFPETEKYLPAGISKYIPCPIRSELFLGSKSKGGVLCGFGLGDKPVILVMGGSQGAQRINEALLGSLPNLIEKYFVVHLTGKGKAIAFSNPSYKSFEFLGDELKDVFAITDLVVSRAGANSIFEMLALQIPMLLIPLEVGSRGDQILNAKSFEKKGWAHVLNESALTPKIFQDAIEKLNLDRAKIKSAQAIVDLKDSGKQIVDIISENSRSI